MDARTVSHSRSIRVVCGATSRYTSQLQEEATCSSTFLRVWGSMDLLRCSLGQTWYQCSCCRNVCRMESRPSGQQTPDRRPATYPYSAHGYHQYNRTDHTWQAPDTCIGMHQHAISVMMSSSRHIMARPSPLYVRIRGMLRAQPQDPSPAVAPCARFVLPLDLPPDQASCDSPIASADLAAMRPDLALHSFGVRRVSICA